MAQRLLLAKVQALVLPLAQACSQSLQVQHEGSAHAFKERANPMPRESAKQPFFKLIITLSLSRLLKDERQTKFLATSLVGSNRY
jgi:hypothetical protein